MKEALKYLQAGAIVPVDMETTILLVNALKEALAEPEQEPVAWISHNAGLYHFKPDESLDPLPLYLTPPPCPTCEALARTVMMDQTGRDA